SGGSAPSSETCSDTTAACGGAIRNRGTLALVSVVVSGSVAQGASGDGSNANGGLGGLGGGIDNEFGASLTVRTSTVRDNVATGGAGGFFGGGGGGGLGGGIYNEGTLLLDRSTLATNLANGGGSFGTGGGGGGLGAGLFSRTLTVT